MLEIEAKFIVDDFDQIEKKYSFGDPVLQKDTYYQHPSHDFLNTNEWFRIRQSGTNHLLCYKSDAENSGSGVKIRKEIDFAVDQKMVEILDVLGFTKLITVEKYRRSTKLHNKDFNFSITITLDEVIGLGKYVEIEILSETDKPAAVDAIELLAKELHLSKLEVRGYAKIMLMPSPKITRA